MKALVVTAFLTAAIGYGIGYWQGSGQPPAKPRVTDSDPAAAPTSAATDQVAPAERDVESPAPEQAYRGQWPDLFQLYEDHVPGKRLSIDVMALLGSLDDTELHDLVTQALDHPDQMAIQMLTFRAISELGRRDPVAALDFYASLPVRDRRQYAAGLFRGMASVDPENAWRTLDTYKETDVGAYATTQEVGNMRWAVLWELAGSQGKIVEAMALSRQMQDPRFSKRMAEQMANMLVRQNPENALQQFSGDSGADQLVLNAVVKNVAETNAQSAVDWLTANPDMASADNMKDVADNLAVAQGVGALDSLFGQFEDPDLQDAIATQAVMRSIRDDPQTAADWVNRFHNSQNRVMAGSQALSELGVNDNLPDHLSFIALAYADTQGSRQNLLSQTVWSFNEADPEGVQRLADSLAQNEPETYREVGKNFGWDMSVLPPDPDDGG